MKKNSSARKSLYAIATLGLCALFVAALFISARFGTNAALARLPDSAKKGLEADYPIGVTVVVGGDGEPVFLSRKVQPLRDFFFVHRGAKARRAAETETSKLRRFIGEIRVRTVLQDADLVNVEVQSGALNGDFYWIHVSQLPDAVPGEGAKLDSSEAVEPND